MSHAPSPARPASVLPTGTTASPASSSPVQTSASRKVLIVEDEALIALDLERRMKRLGFDVVGSADNCPNALELFGAAQPELVLMDIFIQGAEDGIETARAIGRLGDVPVIFITAFADSDTVRRAAAVSPYGYILKPFDDNTLAATVHVALERHAADTRLRLLDAAVSSSQVGVEVIALRGDERETVFVNQAFATMHGNVRESFIGKPPVLLGREASQENLKLLQEAMRTTTPTSATISLGKAEGGITYDAVTLSSVQDRAGKTTHLLSLHSDVTRQHAAELALEVSQRMELMGRLTAAIAHDFNNVLGAIVAFADLARDSATEPSVRADLDEILGAARSGAVLARKLLEFPRGNDGDKPITADLAHVLPQFRSVLERVAGPRVNIVVELAEAPLAAAIDAHSVEQVLLNLVTNARDAMPQGGRVVLSAERPAASSHHFAGGAYIQLRVVDNGQGMSEEIRQRSFEPLFTTKPRGKGTGLGLATCKMLVERCGGFIEVQSEMGRGTTFNIELPAAPSVPHDDPADRAKLAQWAGRAGGALCLLVDDEAPLRRACGRALRDVGFSVIEAVDGEQALREIDTYGTQLRLVVSDLLLPGKNGEDVVAHARGVHPQVATLLISGYFEKTRDGGIALEDVLWKPFSLSVLAQRALDALAAATTASIPSEPGPGL
jgi:two-component system cell cycle sensor histidine kinase/response regulator CckA